MTRILMLGDSPYVRTGFGVVNEIAHEHLKGLGHTLITIGGQDGTAREIDGHVFIPRDDKNPADIMGWTQVPKAIEIGFDAVHIIADAAMTCLWGAYKDIRDKPLFAYTPIEGAPLNGQWVKAFQENPNWHIVTASNYGVAELARVGVKSRMAYHGVSPDFYQYSKEDRDKWRKRLGWENKFVVMNVAQNVRRKQWPRLFEAIKIAKRQHPNIILYAHTVPFNNYWLEGHNLAEIAENIGIWDEIFFPPKHTKHNAATDLHGEEYPGLVDMYNLADCFVLPSQVEGFGLPLAEAMACGLPVATTNYAAQAEVVGDAGILIPVHDWEWNKSSARYANVSPKDIANAIHRFASSSYIEGWKKKSLERAKLFTWDAYKKELGDFFGNEEAKASSKKYNSKQKKSLGVGAEAFLA